MIQFAYDWSDFLNQLIFVFAVAVLPLQLWLLVFRNFSGFSGRLALRLGLNLLLWIAIMAFILQPYFKRESSSATGIVFGKDVPVDFYKSLTDSLKSEEILDFTDFNDQENLAGLDTVILAGQEYDPFVFSTLSRSEHRPKIKFVPYFKPDQFRKLSWKGLLRKGEIQTVTGNVAFSGKQVLKLRYGSRTLDSLMLKKGDQSFRLSFPAFTQGRTTVELYLADKMIDTIRFFARPLEPLTFLFILDNPDFESRNLAGWLGRNGHAVQYNAALSRDIQSKLTINKAKDPDVVITDAGNASHTVVKKAVAAGKSVLFINLTDPASEIAAINGALGTKLQVRKTSDEQAITISPELTALPYQFINSNRYLSVPDYPAAVEKTRGNVGVSLLNETFPLMLTGDSITYQKVWNTIIASVHPATKSNIDVSGPVYKDLKTAITLNNFAKKPQLLQIGTDTVFMTSSAINPLSAAGSFVPNQSGWLTLPDSLETEIYVRPLDATSNLAKTEEFIRSYNSNQKRFNNALPAEIGTENGIKKYPSSWVWFSIVMICLAGVWVEGKL